MGEPISHLNHNFALQAVLPAVLGVLPMDGRDRVLHHDADWLAGDAGGRG